MFELIIAGVVSALAVLVLLFKIGIRKCLYFDVPLDIGVTVFLGIIFSGTYSGMIAAIIGGLIFSIILWGLKNFIGYERLTRKGWVPVPPSF